MEVMSETEKTEALRAEFQGMSNHYPAELAGLLDAVMENAADLGLSREDSEFWASCLYSALEEMAVEGLALSDECSGLTATCHYCKREGYWYERDE